MPKYTPQELKLLEALGDGRRHCKFELKDLLSDGHLNGRTALPKAICVLRKKLNPIGEDIICEFYRRAIYYRHVRLLGRE